MTHTLTKSDLHNICIILDFPPSTWRAGLGYPGLTDAARNCLTDVIEGRLTKEAVMCAGDKPSFYHGRKLGRKLTKQEMREMRKQHHGYGKVYATTSPIFISHNKVRRVA
jgi:hypothetical protein